MNQKSPHIHRGMPVLLPPLRGHAGSTYAMVERIQSPHVVMLVITADSGGRRRGATYAAPLACVASRPRGLHRRARAWIGRNRAGV